MAAQGDALKLELDATVAKLGSVAGGGVQEPSAPPGLINQQLEYLQAAVGGLAGRLQSAESKGETFEAAIKDAQAKIDRLVSSGRTVGSNDPWQPMASEQAAPTAVSAPERYDL